MKTPISEVAQAIASIPEFGSIRAVARHTNHKTDTIISWIDMIDGNKKEIKDYLYNNLHYTTNKVDEIWSYIKKGKRKFNNEKMK